MDLKDFSEQELQNELHSRKELRDKTAREERRERFALLLKHRDPLLDLVPHTRTSCSDQFPSNGLGSAGYGARCSRCALLELVESDSMDYDFGLQLDFSRVGTE